MAILPTDIRILFTNYDIIAYFLNLASCSEHFISIKYRILATFNINKKNQFELLYAFKIYQQIKTCLNYFLPVITHSIFYTFSQTLSNVLELRVTETEGQRLQRNQYKYEQLHDLQSRLMLVAGKAEKGKDDVDRFMLVCLILH